MKKNGSKSVSVHYKISYSVLYYTNNFIFISMDIVSVKKGEDMTYVSVLRIVAIYWVVLVQHNFAPFSSAWGWIAQGEYFDAFKPIFSYTKYITSITMPLCFFISGFVMDKTNALNRKKVSEFFLNKTCRIILPCYVWGTVFLLIYNRGVISLEFLLGYQHMWFLFHLYIIFLMYLLPLRHASNRRVIMITALTISFYLLSFTIHSNTLHHLLQNAIYFILGVSVSRYSYKLDLVKKWQAYIVICLAVLFYDNLYQWGGGTQL